MYVCVCVCIWMSNHQISYLIVILLSCRASIDEVETEVVEIEAKLDKVRYDNSTAPYVNVIPKKKIHQWIFTHFQVNQRETMHLSVVVGKACQPLQKAPTSA